MPHFFRREQTFEGVMVHIQAKKKTNNSSQSLTACNCSWKRSRDSCGEEDVVVLSKVNKTRLIMWAVTIQSRNKTMFEKWSTCQQWNSSVSNHPLSLNPYVVATSNFSICPLSIHIFSHRKIYWESYSGKFENLWRNCRKFVGYFSYILHFLHRKFPTKTYHFYAGEKHYAQNAGNLWLICVEKHHFTV